MPFQKAASKSYEATSPAGAIPLRLPLTGSKGLYVSLHPGGAVLQLAFLQLLADLDGSGLEVSTVPGEAQGLRFPHAGELDHLHDDFQAVPGGHLEEVFDLGVGQRDKFLLLNTGERHTIRRGRGL